MKKSLLTLLCFLSLGLFAANAETLTITMSEICTNATAAPEIKDDASGITIEWGKSTGGKTAPTYYSSGDCVRMYANTFMKITAPESVTLDKITYTWVKKGKNWSSLTITDNTLSIANNIATLSCSTTDNGVRSITIEYTNGGGQITDNKPIITITGSEGNGGYEIGATATITANDGYTIWYTTDASDPSTSETSIMSDGNIVENITLALGKNTIKAITLDAELNESEVTTKEVTIVKKAHGLDWSTLNCDVNFGDENPELPTLINPNNLPVTYSSSNPDVATVDNDGNVEIVGAGKTQIRATFTETTDGEYADYAGGYKYYTLTVVEPADATYDFSPAAIDNIGAYGMTVYTDGTQYENDAANPVSSITNGNVTLDFTGQYRIWGSAKGVELRIQENATMEFTAALGYKITRIVFTSGAIGSKWNTKLNKADKDNINKDWKPTESVKSVKFIQGGQSQIGTISVYLESFLEVAVEVTDHEGNVMEGNGSFSLADKEWVNVKIACSDPNAKVYHYHAESAVETQANAPARIRKNYVEHPAEGVKISKAGTFSYYVEDAEGNELIAPASITFEGSTTGVADITVDDVNAQVEYYNLQGVRVENPANGLYIRRQGSKASKVYVK